MFVVNFTSLPPPDRLQLREAKFILAHDFRSFSLLGKGRLDGVGKYVVVTMCDEGALCHGGPQGREFLQRVA